jgi:hypothetical protein
VVLDAKESKELAPISLRVLRGMATFDVRTPGAQVALVSPRERRELKVFSSPIEVDTTRRWTLEATKPGFEDYRVPLVFDGDAQKTFVIDLRQKENPGVVVVQPPSADVCTVALRNRVKSTVYLDGRMLGDSPRVGVTVVPDVSHTAIFVRSDGTKDTLNFSCKKGESRSFFPPGG